VFSGGSLGTYHREENGDSLTINGSKIDPLGDHKQAGVLRLEVGESAMRNGHAFTDSSRLEFLPLQENVLNGRKVHVSR
jgi:hypothetical protein